MKECVFLLVIVHEKGCVTCISASYGTEYVFLHERMSISVYFC